jgi:hypothetical protein
VIDDNDLDDMGVDDDYPDERTPTPEFGCACQDPIVVDEVCFGCRRIMAEQLEEGRREQ